MREILFRGKRIDNGEWVCGYYVYDDSGQLTEKPRADIIRLHEHPCGFSMIPFEVIFESISEFTGLTDKNGTKIFEGDIVKIELLGGFEIGQIVYSEICCRFKFADKYGSTYGFDDTCTFEVIGNIHDNPELLKGDKSDA